MLPHTLPSPGQIVNALQVQREINKAITHFEIVIDSSSVLPSELPVFRKYLAEASKYLYALEKRVAPRQKFKEPDDEDQDQTT